MTGASALQQLGFSNAFTLKHLIDELAGFLSPKTAY